MIEALKILAGIAAIFISWKVYLFISWNIERVIFFRGVSFYVQGKKQPRNKRGKRNK